MISQNQERNVKPIFAGKARALMAPPIVKALPEPSSLAGDEGWARPSGEAVRTQNGRRLPDRHIHSLGYGIDE